MRTNDILLDGFEDIKVLMQYLYMSEDNSILIHNCINVPLKIRMDENCQFKCQNMNFPELPESNWAEEMTVPVMLDIIEKLKEEPAVEFKERFKNRWEELKNVTKINVSLNERKQRR